MVLISVFLVCGFLGLKFFSVYVESGFYYVYPELIKNFQFIGRVEP